MQRNPPVYFCSIMKAKRIVKTFFTGIVIFLVSFGFGGCGAEEDGREKLPPMVKTAVVQKQDDCITISYPAKVIAEQDVNLSFRIAGPISRVRVAEGERVHKGDVLAEMDPRDYKIQLDATTAQYNQIKAEAERVMELYKRNSATQNDYDKAYYGLQQITSLLHAHTNALADTRLKAPFDGYVHKIIFGANETVAAGTPVIAMISDGDPQVSVNIPSVDYVNAGNFNRFYCTINVFPGRTYPLDLINISKKANLNQLFTATFVFKKGLQNLPSPGMSANVFIEYRYGSNPLVSVPVSAIFSEDGDSYVWVIRADETVSRRRITPMDITGKGIAVISSGLDEGERIVTAGVHVLQEGEKIRIMKENSKTNIGNLL